MNQCPYVYTLNNKLFDFRSPCFLIFHLNQTIFCKFKKKIMKKLPKFQQYVKTMQSQHDRFFSVDIFHLRKPTRFDLYIRIYKLITGNPSNLFAKSGCDNEHTQPSNFCALRTNKIKNTLPRNLEYMKIRNSWYMLLLF